MPHWAARPGFGAGVVTWTAFWSANTSPCSPEQLSAPRARNCAVYSPGVAGAVTSNALLRVPEPWSLVSTHVVGFGWLNPYWVPCHSLPPLTCTVNLALKTPPGAVWMLVAPFSVALTPVRAPAATP